MAFEGQPMPKEEAAASRRPRRLGALIATAAGVVGLATGVITLKDQLFSSDRSARESGGSSGVNAPQRREVAEFTGIAGHFQESRAFIEFLIAHDKETVNLDVSLRVPVDGGASGFPATILKTDCDPGATPGSEFCNGVNILVFGAANRVLRSRCLEPRGHGHTPHYAGAPYT